MKKNDEALFLLSDEKIFLFDDKIYSYQELKSISDNLNLEIKKNLGDEYRIIFKPDDCRNDVIEYVAFVQKRRGLFYCYYLHFEQKFFSPFKWEHTTGFASLFYAKKFSYENEIIEFIDEYKKENNKKRLKKLSKSKGFRSI